MIGQSKESESRLYLPIKLLLDEDTHHPLAGALRNRGYDAVHVAEIHRFGLSDVEQLNFAIRDERCLFSFNRSDFARLHAAYSTSGVIHFGIILSRQMPIHRCFIELLRFLQTHSAIEVRSNIYFLKFRPGFASA